MKHGSALQDAVSGRTDITLTGGSVKMERGIPPTGSAGVDMSDWTCESNGATFRMILRPHEGMQFHGAAVGALDDTRYRAFIQWLEDHRTTSGNPVYGGDWDTFTDYSLFGRNFGFDQDVDPNVASTLDVRSSGSGYGPDRVRIEFALNTGSPAYDVDKINAYFGALVQPVDTDQAIDTPVMGGEETPVIAALIRFPGADLTEQDGIPTWRRPSGMHTLGSVYGKIADLGDLVTVSGELFYRIPWDNVDVAYDLRAVHVVASSGLVIRLDPVADMVRNRGESVDLEFHNDNPAGGHIVEIATDDGSNIITLYPGDNIPLRIVLHDDGSGDIRSIGTALRVYELAGSSAGDFDDVNYMTSGSTRFRPVPKPSGSNILVNTHHEDAFEVAGTGTFSNGASPTPTTPRYLPQSVKVLKAGKVRYECEFAIRSGSSGSISNGHGLQLLENSTLVEPNIIYRVMNTNEQRTWWFIREFEGEVDDILTPLHKYPDYSSMPPDNIQIAAYRVRITLEHSIHVEEAI